MTPTRRRQPARHKAFLAPVTVVKHWTLEDSDLNWGMRLKVQHAQENSGPSKPRVLMSDQFIFSRWSEGRKRTESRAARFRAEQTC